MSEREVDRHNILLRLQEKTLKQYQAAAILGLTTRHVRNLLNSFLREGKKGLISKKRGKASNHQLPPAKREAIKQLIRSQYADFNPTLAREKLLERDGIKVSIETVRTIMIEQHLWIPNIKKRVIHQRRERRKHFGELIQGDASTHDWFEGRRGKCALTVLIDDATSIITALHFNESECLDGYYRALEMHLKKFGRPINLYTDRHAIFKTTRKSGKVEYKDTQLKRALKKLDIGLILARSPQAKGRVERANQTLQNRLVKEMRLRGINTLEEANAYLPTFMKEYNAKFGREPIEHEDVHRALLPTSDLKRILCPIDEREISKDLTFQYKRTHYQIKNHSYLALRGQKVEIKEVTPGKLEVWCKGEKLNFCAYRDMAFKPTKPTLNWKARRWYSPPINHPWRQISRERFSK